MSEYKHESHLTSAIATEDMSREQLLAAIAQQRLQSGNHNDANLAYLLMSLGNLLHTQTSHLTEAIKALNDALDIYSRLEESDYTKSILQIKTTLGLVYLGQNTEQSLQYAESALEQAFDLTEDHTNERAETQYNLGLLYKTRQNYSEAIRAFGEARDIYQNLDNQPKLARTLLELCTVMHNELLAVTDLAHPLTGQQEALADCWRYLGDTENKLKENSDKALKYWNSALTQYRLISDSEKYKAEIDAIQSRIGSAHQANGQFDFAISAFEQVKELYSDLNDETPHANLARAYRRLGFAYFSKASANLQLDPSDLADCFDDARSCLQQARQMFHALHMQEEERAVTNLLSRIPSNMTAPHETPDSLYIKSGSTESNDSPTSKRNKSFIRSLCRCFSWSQDTGKRVQLENTAANPMQPHN